MDRRSREEFFELFLSGRDRKKERVKERECSCLREADQQMDLTSDLGVVLTGNLENPSTRGGCNTTTKGNRGAEMMERRVRQ
jgi:hypothetical protein